MEQQRHLQAVKNGVVAIVPIIIVGSFCQIPLGLGNLIGGSFGAWVTENSAIFTFPTNFTTNIMSLFSAFFIAESLAKTYGMKSPSMQGVCAVLVQCVLCASFVGDVTTVWDVASFGSEGLFVSGMGCGSMGIYSHELFNKYDCEMIIRAGSCGAYAQDLQLKEIIVADSCYSESSYAKTYSGFEGNIVYPDSSLSDELYRQAMQQGLQCRKGRIHTSDCFYYKKKVNIEDLRDQKGCLGVDMESFALLHNAAIAEKRAAVLFTVSDLPQKKEKLSSIERERSFDGMIQIALETLWQHA